MYFYDDHIKARDGDFQSRKCHEVGGKFTRNSRMRLEMIKLSMEMNLALKSFHRE